MGFSRRTDGVKRHGGHCGRNGSAYVCQPPPFIPSPPDYCMCWLMDMKVVLFNAYIYQAGPNAKIAKKGFCFLFIIIKHFVETQNAFNWSSPTKMS